MDNRAPVTRNRSIAEEYHQLTKYAEESIRSMPGMDWSKQPAQFKEIVASKRVSLRDAHPLGALGRLLFHGNGVTGRESCPIPENRGLLSGRRFSAPAHLWRRPADRAR